MGFARTALGTWRLFVRQGDVDALFDAAGRVLACYSIDETRLRLTDATA
jgi:hypothetical protein